MLPVLNAENDIYLARNPLDNNTIVKTDFEKRGVSFKLIKRIGEMTKIKYPNKNEKDISIAFVSNVINGTHELLKPNCRWGQIDILDTLTGITKISLIDTLLMNSLDAPHPIIKECYNEVVNKATIFISFPYTLLYNELILCLENFFNDNPKFHISNTYFWFDCFVNNQWKADIKGFDWWCSTFQDAIKEIGNTLIILTPYNNPEYLARAWCLFEMYCSINTNCNMFISITKKDNKLFIDDMKINGINVIHNMLMNIDSKKSTCYDLEDRDKIFDVIRKTVGFNRINYIIFDRLRDFVIDTTNSAINNTSDNEEYNHLVLNLARLYKQQSKFIEAEKIYIELLNNNKIKLGIENESTIILAMELFETLLSQLKIKEANNIWNDIFDKILIYSDIKSDLSSTIYDSNLILDIYNLRANLYVLQIEYSKSKELYYEILNRKIELYGDYNINTLQANHNYLENEISFIISDVFHGFLSHNIINMAIGTMIYAITLFNDFYGDLGDQEIPFFLIIEILLIIYAILHNIFAIINIINRNNSISSLQLLITECYNKREIVLGKNHIDTLKTSSILAISYSLKLNFSKSEKLFDEYLINLATLLGETHDDLLLGYEQLIKIYKRFFKFYKTREFEIKHIYIYYEKYGSNHPKFFEKFDNLLKNYTGGFIVDKKGFNELMKLWIIINPDFHTDFNSYLNSCIYTQFYYDICYLYQINYCNVPRWLVMNKRIYELQSIIMFYKGKILLYYFFIFLILSRLTFEYFMNDDVFGYYLMFMAFNLYFNCLIFILYVIVGYMISKRYSID